MEAKVITPFETEADGTLPLDAVECAWFLLCTRPATDAVNHPILGAVPCCASCAEFARS